MRAEDVKVNLEELKKFKKKNAEERLWFIDYWVDYIKRHKLKQENLQPPK
jgi:hypothetical protein